LWTFLDPAAVKRGWEGGGRQTRRVSVITKQRDFLEEKEEVD